MGLMLIAPKIVKNIDEMIYGLDYVEGYQNVEETGKLLYQGIILDLKIIYKTIVCLYIRETPNDRETKEIACRFHKSDCIMGDLNLNPSVLSQKNKLLKLSKKELKKQTAVKKLVNKTETKVITNWLFYHFQITEERICASQMQSYLVS